MKAPPFISNDLFVVTAGNVRGKGKSVTIDLAAAPA
jgi:hypothetical protein